MSLLLTIVTVSSFDHLRLKLTLESMRLLPAGAEHIFIIPENDLTSRDLLEEASVQGVQLKFYVDNNTGVYSAMNLGFFGILEIYCSPYLNWKCFFPN